MIFITSFVKGIVLLMFSLSTGYMLILGKNKTGIKFDYAFFTVFLLLVLWVL